MSQRRIGASLHNLLGAWESHAAHLAQAGASHSCQLTARQVEAGKQLVSLTAFLSTGGQSRHFHRVRTPRRRGQRVWPSSSSSSLGSSRQQQLQQQQQGGPPALNSAIYTARGWRQINDLLRDRREHFGEASITAALVNLAHLRPGAGSEPEGLGSAGDHGAADVAGVGEGLGQAAVASGGVPLWLDRVHWQQQQQQRWHELRAAESQQQLQQQHWEWWHHHHHHDHHQQEQDDEGSLTIVHVVPRGEEEQDVRYSMTAPWDDSSAAAAAALEQELQQQQQTTQQQQQQATQQPGLGGDAAGDAGEVRQLADSLLGMAAERLPDFDPRSLANLLWSLARMNILPGGGAAGPGPSAWAPAGASAGTGAGSGGGAGGQASRCPVGLSEFVSAAAVKAGSMDAQALCNTLWALSVLGYNRPQHLQVFTDALARKFDGCSLQGLTLFLFGTASLRHYPGDEQMQRAAQGAARRLAHGGCTPDNLTHLVWGLGAFGYRPGAAQGGGHGPGRERVDGGGDVGALRGGARGVGGGGGDGDADALLMEAMTLATRHAREFGAGQLASLLQGFAAFVSDDPPLAAQGCRLFAKLAELPQDEWRHLQDRLYFLELMYRQALGIHSSLMHPGQEGQREAAAGFLSAEQRRADDPARRRLREELGGWLTRLGVSHQQAAQLPDLPLVADFVLHCPKGGALVGSSGGGGGRGGGGGAEGRPVVLLLHGEGSVAHNDFRRLMGFGLLRHRLLQSAGYRVLDLGEPQWRSWAGWCQGAQQAQQGAQQQAQQQAQQGAQHGQQQDLPSREEEEEEEQGGPAAAAVAGARQEAQLRLFLQRAGCLQ